MPPSYSVKALPAELLSELRKRLAATAFGKYEEHSEWLTANGHPISKSALQRYAAEHRAEILAEVAPQELNASLDLRLRCLEIASALDSITTPDELIAAAERLLMWAYKQ